MNLCNEGLEQKRFQILHIQTAGMIADRLTKALEKKKFYLFMNNFLGTVKK